MKSWLPVLLFALLIAAVALPIVRPPVSASPQIPADTLKQFEADFMKSAAEKGSAGYLSYYADDAVELPNGGPVIRGKTNIAPGMSFLDDKNNRLIWTPVGADISASGDLGLYLRQLWVSLEKQSRQGDGRIRQIRQHLEIAERRKLESRPRHGQCQRGAEIPGCFVAAWLGLLLASFEAPRYTDCRF